MYGSVIGCSTQTSDGKYVQAERMFCAKIYNMQPNTNMRSNSRYKCSVSWQVLKSIVSTGKQSLHFNLASSFIAAHTDRHCTMDHDHSYFSFMATYRCKRLFQTTKLHTQSRLQNCTLKPDYRIAHSYFISTMRHIYKDPNIYIYFLSHGYPLQFLKRLVACSS